jgi:hypothetical protein
VQRKKTLAHNAYLAVITDATINGSATQSGHSHSLFYREHTAASLLPVHLFLGLRMMGFIRATTIVVVVVVVGGGGSLLQRIGASEL